MFRSTLIAATVSMAFSTVATPAIADEPGGPEVQPIRLVTPAYPDSKRAERQEGYVTFEYTVDEKGHARDLKVVDAEPGTTFIGAARRALMRSEFEPPEVDGEPQAVTGLTRTYVFDKPGRR
jgi:protein TonB